MLRRDELFEQRIIVALHGRVHFFRVHMKQMAARKLSYRLGCAYKLNYNTGFVHTSTDSLFA